MSSQIFSLMKYYGKVSIVHYMSKHERKLANAFTKMGYTRDKTIIFQIWVTSTPIYLKSIFYIRHQTKEHDQSSCLNLAVPRTRDK